MKGQGKNDNDPASERSRQNGGGKFIHSKVRTAPVAAPPSIRQGSEQGLAPPPPAVTGPPAPTAASTIPLSPASPAAHLTEKDVQGELDRILQTLQLLKERNLVKPTAPGTNSVRRKWTAIQQVLQQSCDNKSDNLVDKSLKESLPNGQIVRSSEGEAVPAETAGTTQNIYHFHETVESV